MFKKSQLVSRRRSLLAKHHRLLQPPLLPGDYNIESRSSTLAFGHHWWSLSSPWCITILRHSFSMNCLFTSYPTTPSHFLRPPCAKCFLLSPGSPLLRLPMPLVPKNGGNIPFTSKPHRQLDFSYAWRTDMPRTLQNLPIH